MLGVRRACLAAPEAIGTSPLPQEGGDPGDPPGAPSPAGQRRCWVGTPSQPGTSPLPFQRTAQAQASLWAMPNDRPN